MGDDSADDLDTAPDVVRSALMELVGEALTQAKRESTARGVFISTRG